MDDNNSVCKVVAQGGVGESGASSMLSYTVDAEISKMMVLRRDDSSLCPNTGAVAMLVINGEVIVSGSMMTENGVINCEAAPGDHVIAIVHTIPLFNDIMCFRLGELNFRLEACDLIN